MEGLVCRIGYHLLEGRPVVVPSGHGPVDVSVDDGIATFLGVLRYDADLTFDGLLVLPFGGITGIDDSVFAFALFAFIHDASLLCTYKIS